MTTNTNLCYCDTESYCHWCLSDMETAEERKHAPPAGLDERWWHDFNAAYQAIEQED